MKWASCLIAFAIGVTVNDVVAGVYVGLYTGRGSVDDEVEFRAPDWLPGDGWTCAVDANSREHSGSAQCINDQGVSANFVWNSPCAPASGECEATASVEVAVGSTYDGVDPHEESGIVEWGVEPEESPVPDASPVVDTSGGSVAQQWLVAHNRYRALHGAPALQWSSAIASGAQAYADTCPSGHSATTPYGENLAWGYPDVQSVVDAWYGEEASYDYTKPGFSSATGHFTQVVWRGTTEVGCGQSSRCSWPAWVCRYNPPGNYLGEFSGNVLAPR